MYNDESNSNVHFPKPKIPAAETGRNGQGVDKIGDPLRYFAK